MARSSPRLAIVNRYKSLRNQPTARKRRFVFPDIRLRRLSVRRIDSPAGSRTDSWYVPGKPWKVTSQLCWIEENGVKQYFTEYILTETY